MTNKISVKLPDGGVIVLQGRKWRAEGKVPSKALYKAQFITEDYVYSASDGVPGCKLAGMVAKALGGKAILPNFPPGPKNVMY